MPVNTRSNSLTTAEDADSRDSIMALTVDQKLDLILKDIADIKNFNNKFTNDISEIKNDMNTFKKDINESVDMNYLKLEDTDKKVKSNQQSILSHERQIESLTSELTVVKKQVAELQQSLAVSNQYSRCNSLEIHGIPETKNENIMEVVMSVAKALNFNLKESMIDTVHRLAPNQSKPEAHRGIIIKFCRRLDMEGMRSKTRVKNGFSAAELGMNSDSKIYINLSLTKHLKVLWSDVRAFKNEKGFKYAWITSAGKVFLRKNEGSRAILITKKSDLDKFK